MVHQQLSSNKCHIHIMFMLLMASKIFEKPALMPEILSTPAYTLLA